MIENSFIEINANALQNNISFMKSRLGSECEFVSVVKGNAYGHGIKNFVPVAVDCGLKSFAVFSAFEARRIQELELDLKRIMIMGFVDSNQIEWAVEKGIEFYVFDLNRLKEAIAAAEKIGTKAKVHIEVETGLNRTGFNMKALKNAFSIIQDNEAHVEVKGVCSHLAGAENIANFFRIKNQIRKFKAYIKTFEKSAVTFEKAHLACSAAIMNYGGTIKDLARVGIMQYGLWPSKEVKMAFAVSEKVMEDPLKPVLSWKSKVMSTKEVKMGQYVGYGSTFMAEMDMKIATVPVGYADGFARSLSNQGKVLIQEQRLDVVGIVNMNLCVVDVTNAPTVKAGDEVVLIGNQGENSVSVASFSDFSSQLNYELLTRLPNDIPRIITR